MICWNIPVIIHTAEKNLISTVETAGIRCFSIVPFSRAKRVITGLPEPLAHSDVIFRDFLSLSLNMKKRSSGMKHGAAWHADRAASPSRDMGMCKHSTGGNERIKIRGVNLAVSQGADRIESLVVCEKEEDVPSVTHI